MCGAGDDVVDETVFQGFRGGEPAVAVRIGLDAFDRLAGEFGVEPEHLLLDDGELLGLDGDVGRAAGHPAQRLVHQDAGVRQRVTLALGARRQQELAHRGGHAHRVGGDVAGRQHHGVVDRHAGADRSARGVDVEVDVLGGVFGGEQQNLRAQPIGDFVVHLRAQEDDALGEQALIDRVGEVETLRVRTHVSHDWVTCFLEFCYAPTLTNRAHCLAVAHP